MHEYEIVTKIDRDFNPEVEGETIDSIMGCCPGYENHSVPLRFGKTIIRLITNRRLDTNGFDYLVKQFEDEFGVSEETRGVVTKITDVTGVVK
jgi:hypothetical protein